MKKHYTLFCIFVCGIFFMFSSCVAVLNNSDDTATGGVIYKDIENPAFEELVRGKSYYSKWFPNIQTVIDFDTDNNTVTYTQYYPSRYNAQLGPEDPPEYPFDYKYIRKSKYLFTEDLKDMATVTLEHYKTLMNGSQRDDFSNFSDKPEPLLFSKVRDDGAIIKWDYEKFYTAEAMDELGFDNYILHPELIGPKKK